MANDFVAQLAKRPPQVKLAILVAIMALLGGVYWQLFYTSLSDELKGAKSQHVTLQAENKKLKDDLDKWNDLALEKDRLDAKLAKNEISLPASSELPAFFAHLQKQAAAAGVTIKSWKREGEKPVETYVRVPVAIEIRGTFYQINKYFHLLFQTDRIISVEDLELGTPVGRGDDIQLAASFTAATYRQADAPPAEAPDAKGPDGKPVGADAAKPAGTDKGPGSAGSIKERTVEKVEAANDKKETQADKAAGVKQPEATPSSTDAKKSP